MGTVEPIHQTDTEPDEHRPEGHDDQYTQDKNFEKSQHQAERDPQCQRDHYVDRNHHQISPVSKGPLYVLYPSSVVRMGSQRTINR